MPTMLGSRTAQSRQATWVRSLPDIEPPANVAIHTDGARPSSAAGPTPGLPRHPKLAARARRAPESLSPAQRATHRFVSVWLEVAGGYRPATHLRPLCRPECFAAIAAHPVGPMPRGKGVRSTPQTPVMNRPRTGAPPRDARGATANPGERVEVRRVRVSDAIEGVVEAAVVLANRDRTWAVALRLEWHDGHWLCAHLQVI